MAKAGSVSRLLRALMRTGRAQQKLVDRLAKHAALTGQKKRRQAELFEPRQHARPDVTPAPGKWGAGRFTYSPRSPEGHLLRMAYWLYLPDHTPASAIRQGWPLIVMLHGCNQSATQFAKGTRMNHLAEKKGYAVLYPQQSLSVQAHRCWRWYSPTVQAGGAEAAALAELIEEVCTQHRIDRRRIYVAGISAGAGMAAILALNHPGLFAAVGLHSGPVYGAGRNAVDGLRVMQRGSAANPHAPIDEAMARHAATARPSGTSNFPVIPAILLHGDDDKAVHPVNQDQLALQWLRLNRIPSRGAEQRVTYKPAGRGGKRHACEIRDYLIGNRPTLRVVRIAGLGHEWSGGDPAERFHAMAGPDAGQMMLSFFGKHRR
jgi:poly(hydroxyalkanoate) depolymerase family esterase